MSGRIGPIAWLVWFIAAGAIPLTSRNPLYVALVLLAVIVVHMTAPTRGDRAKPWRLFAYVGSSVAVLSIAFNVLTVHAGDSPFAELPEWLPIIGGPLTYNALVYGIASALAISGLLFAAATFNSAVSHIELIRRLPMRFQRLGVSAAIAMNFVPQTIRAGQDIYDAQRARGRNMRNVGDARAFLVPLLGNGLERAVQMSEALETRGYGRSDPSADHSGSKPWRAWLSVSLVVATLPLVATGRLFETLILAVLAVAASGIFSLSGPRQVSSQGWNTPSALVVTTSLAALALIGFGMATTTTLEYSPFPRLEWPQFDPLVGVAICLLLSPTLVLPGPNR
jgi:energy-coupling factor transport system permease protein